MAPSMAHRARDPSQSIEEALTKARRVAEEIKKAADELDAIHAVLQQGVPGNPCNPDVQEAVHRTQELGRRLYESSQTLDRANALLDIQP